MSRFLFPTTCLILAFGLLGAAEPAQAPATKTTVDIGAWKAAVVIPKPAVAGKALDVDFTLTPATPKPKTVRLWVGKADARGSVKVKAEAEAAGDYCVGVEVPDPLPEQAQLWIAIEGTDGVISKGMMAVPLK